MTIISNLTNKLYVIIDGFTKHFEENNQSYNDYPKLAETYIKDYPELQEAITSMNNIENVNKHFGI